MPPPGGRGQRWLGLLRLSGVTGAAPAPGDLQWAAAAWRDALRGGDVLARVGADLFAAALGASSLPVALRVLDRLRHSTPEGWTCTVGLTPWEQGAGLSSLTERARSALDEAERAGGDRVAVVRAGEGRRAA